MLQKILHFSNLGSHTQMSTFLACISWNEACKYLDMGVLVPVKDFRLVGGFVSFS